MIRVGIQQPSLAKYRVPVFRELAARQGLSVFLAYGDRSGLKNSPPEGFEAELFRLTRKKLGPVPIYWHQPQITLANKHKSDVLILTWNSQYLSLLPALIRAKLNGVRTILWGHGYSKKEGWLRLTIRKWLGRCSDAVLFYDYHTAGRYVDEYGFRKSKVFVAPNSIDQSPIEQAKAYWDAHANELEQFRQQQELEHGPLILFVSRLHRDNRIDLLIEAACQLRDDFPNLKIAIIGKGDEERKRLEVMASERNVTDQILFTGPIYEERELAKWFLCSDVFCYPANIGLSLLHAFGYGVPVVTSNNVAGQNPEIFAFEDGKNGLFYQDGHVEDLVRKLRMVVTDDALRSRLAEQALQTVRSRFNIRAMVDGMESAVRFVAVQK